ncbi:hypothetical protein EIKCOROL_00450 [Eikenella corrodens ATCC 23834]|uniref:Uncharacterized protein n=1 Tax=Eikenella corrodens ATCC 23834 TaxID=546274 RepID=C0DSX7_EIKCO|nr:hypothetical protein EIKCOROL_00450 [Eikenella corrodens ATCC 23834]
MQVALLKVLMPLHLVKKLKLLVKTLWLLAKIPMQLVNLLLLWVMVPEAVKILQRQLVYIPRRAALVLRQLVAVLKPRLGVQRHWV